jgi:hypothetical protein
LSDVIELAQPAVGPSITNKSRHNLGDAHEHMNLKLLEPLRELFKDELRALGWELGLPQRLVEHHPFPAPVRRSASRRDNPAVPIVVAWCCHQPGALRRKLTC